MNNARNMFKSGPGTELLLLAWLFQFAGWTMNLWAWNWFWFGGLYVAFWAVNFYYWIKEDAYNKDMPRD